MIGHEDRGDRRRDGVGVERLDALAIGHHAATASPDCSLAVRAGASGSMA